MNSQTLRFARIGAFSAIALYLLVAVPLLGLSMAPHVASSAATVSSSPR